MNVLYRSVWDLSRIVTLDGYRDLWRASVHHIRTREEASPATYPACFLLKGVKAPAEAAAVAELRALRPILEIWQGPAAPRADANGGKLPAVAAPKDWRRVDTVDLRDFQNGKVGIARTSAPADAFRLAAILPVPSKNILQAVVLSATPLVASPPPPPDWRGASTLDDSSAADLNKIYNLQPFVEQLTDGTVRKPAPIGLLVLTSR